MPLRIKEQGLTKRPKIVLTWAPHPKALPHAVGNSFTKMAQNLDADFVIAQPKGYELNPEITKIQPLFTIKTKLSKGLILSMLKIGVLIMTMEKF